MTRDESAKALYEAYNAGGDPETANKNYRGEPCPEWADLPANIREKWAAAFDASLIITVDAAFDDDCDAPVTLVPDPTLDGEEPDRHLVIHTDQFTEPGSVQIPWPLAEYIVGQNLGDLRWMKYAGGEYHAELAECINIIAEVGNTPFVYICVNNGNEFDTREESDKYGKTAVGAVAYLLHRQITALSSGFIEGARRLKQASDTLVATMERTAKLRASRAAP